MYVVLFAEIVRQLNALSSIDGDPDDCLKQANKPASSSEGLSAFTFFHSFIHTLSLSFSFSPFPPSLWLYCGFEHPLSSLIFFFPPHAIYFSLFSFFICDTCALVPLSAVCSEPNYPPKSFVSVTMELMILEHVFKDATRHVVERSDGLIWAGMPWWWSEQRRHTFLITSESTSLSHPAHTQFFFFFSQLAHVGSNCSE